MVVARRRARTTDEAPVRCLEVNNFGIKMTDKVKVGGCVILSYDMASNGSDEFSAHDALFYSQKSLNPMNNVSPCSLRVCGERATRQ